MEYPIHDRSGKITVLNSTAILAEAATLGEHIRIMRINHLTAPTPQRTLHWGLSWDGTAPMHGGPCGDEDCAGPWQRMGGGAGMDRDFSAVCYLTGRDLYTGLAALDRIQSVPIGLVEAAWGGTRIEAWTSPAGLAQCEGEGTAKCGPCCSEGVIPGWCKTTEPADKKPFCARMNSTGNGNLCSGLFNGMLAPILPMRFKAMLWCE